MTPDLWWEANVALLTDFLLREEKAQNELLFGTADPLSDLMTPEQAREKAELMLRRMKAQEN